MLTRLGFGLGLVASLIASSATMYASPRCTAQQLPDGQSGTLPSNDAFYVVPDALDQVKPGTILRHRSPPQPIAACGRIPLDLEASHQILYRTTDNLGNATATVLTVLVPRHADFAKVVSYQIAENAASIDCAPSYVSQLGHQRGPGIGTLVMELDLQLAQSALEKGVIVILPDFLGPNSAFLANRLSGQATLDGVRAAINSASFTGISQKPAITLWGYSGGSHATLWAAEIQPTYAPELDIAGAAVGGVIPSITSVIAHANGQRNAGLIATALVGLMGQYPELNDIFAEHALPDYRDKFSHIRHQCSGSTVEEFSNQDILGMFDDRNFLLTNPTLINIFNRNMVGNNIPRIALFLYGALGDLLSPIEETDSLVDRYCAAGANIEYHRVEAISHFDLAFAGAPKALTWLVDAMNGTKRQIGCQRNTVQWPHAF